MKYVLITGASSGIGEAAAQKFHEAGYFVYLLARDKNRLDSIHKLLTRSMPISCDLSDPNQIQELPKKIDFSHVDVLVNNAGIYFTKPNEDFLSLDWQTMFQVNVFAVAQLSALIFPYFKSSGRGSIVMVSSTLAHKPVPQTSAYSASKAAVQNLTATLALEGAPHGIRVNCVSPGIVETPIHNLHKLTPENKVITMKTLNSLQPLSRIGQPRDIAEAIYFLGSEASSWTTGTVLDVDGGITLK